MRLQILPQATEDVVAGYRFYEQQMDGLGQYFRDSIFGDIESLLATAGVHACVFEYHRVLSKRFPFAIYYRLDGEIVCVHAILDCRRNPSWIRRRLRSG